MSANEVMAEIKALPESERDNLFRLLIADAKLREDFEDSITIESRRDEPSRPLASVLKDLVLQRNRSIPERVRR